MSARRDYSLGGFDYTAREFNSPGVIALRSEGVSADSGSPEPRDERQARQPSISSHTSDSSSSQQDLLALSPFPRRRYSVQVPIDISAYSLTHPDFCRDDKVTIIQDATWELSCLWRPRTKWELWVHSHWRIQPLARRVNDTLDRSKRLVRRLLAGKCSECTDDLLDFRLFHGKCRGCSRRREPLLALCEACQHLRLDHLLLCGDSPDEFILPETLQEFILPRTIAESATRLGCSFCQLITHVAKELYPDPQDLEDAQQQHLHMEVVKWGSEQYWHSLEVSPSGSPRPEKIAFFSQQADTRILEIPYSSLCFREESYHPIVSREINWNSIRRQLIHCTESHGICQQPPSRPLPPGFLLIDVWNRQLVPASGQSSFVALSYVWGDSCDGSKVRAERLTINTLRKPGGLQLDRIPRTIRDAMQCCLHLRQRYLWADRLCIIQDDPKSKGAQINAMDAIFSAALLVLIDASGTDMNSGISGLSQKRSHASTQKAFQIPRLGVLSNMLPDLTWGAFGSKWISRGWTYQEGVLAKRKLFFTDSQVFFDCDEESWSEDGRVTANSPGERLLLPEAYLRLWNDPFDSYKEHLKAFSTRSLGYHSDICNAFVGIVHALYPTSDSPLHALPQPSFDRALLWIPEADIFETEKPPASPFPSWSWSSTTDTDEIKHVPDLDGFCGTLVKWFEPRQYDGKHVFQATDALEPDGEFWSEYSAWGMAFASSLGCVKRHLPGMMGETGFDMKSRWPEYRDFYVETFGDNQRETREVSSQTALVNDATLINRPKRSLLLGRAQTARFNICYKLPDHCELHSICPLVSYPFSFIMDNHGNRVGALHSKEHTAKALQLPLQLNRCTRKFTFIALSIMELGYSFKSGPLVGCTCGRCKLDQRVGCLSREFDFSVRYEPVVNVMMIGRRGAFAHRLNLGFIFLSAWAEADRTFEDIFLE